jgi:hypothetical protein
VATQHLMSALAVVALTGCANQHYAKTDVGTLEGKLVVEWYEPDKFVFRPDAKAPLKFTRRNGEVIQPEAFWTDGGSIPRWFWALKNYSPWGYAPSYIIHDYLFATKYCDKPPGSSHTLQSAADVISEVQKTMMESPNFNFGDKVTVYRIHLAVLSPWAANAWNNNPCMPDPPDSVKSAKGPTAIFEIDAGSK